MGYAITQPVDLSDVAREDNPKKIQADTLAALAQATDAAARALIAANEAAAAADTVADVLADTARLDTLAPWYPIRDELFWPTLSGEALPPTNPSYGLFKGRPVHILPTSGGSYLMFPHIPRVSPNSANDILIVSFWLALGASGGGVGTQIVLQLGSSNPRVQLRVIEGSPAFVRFETYDAAGNSEITENPAPFVGNPQPWTSDHFYFVEFVLEDAAAALRVDNVERVRHAARYWPPTAAATNSQFRATRELSTAEPRIGQLRASWS